MGMFARDDCFFSTSFQYLPTGYTAQLFASRAATKTFQTSSAGIGELERMVIFPDTRSGRMKLRWVNWLTNWITSVRSRLSNDITTVRALVWISLLSSGAIGPGSVERVAAGAAWAGGSEEGLGCTPGGFRGGCSGPWRRGVCGGCCARAAGAAAR